MWQNIYFKIIIFVQTRRRSIMPRAAGTFLAQILWHLAEFQPRIPSSPHSKFSPFITLLLPRHSTIAFLFIATFHCYCYILKICSCVSMLYCILYIVLFTFGCTCERDLTWQFTRCSRCSSVHRWHSFLWESGRSKKSPPLYFVNLVYNSGYIFAWTLSIIWSQYVYLHLVGTVC